MARTTTLGPAAGRPMPRLWRVVLELIYRGGVIPWDAEAGPPVPGLEDVVEGPARLAPGRAIDLGCGTGRNAVYLAEHGWDVTAVDAIGSALAAVRRRARKAGVRVRDVRGDVTRLPDLALPGGYDLLVDSACYHMLGADRRPGYSAGVTAMAAPGATLLMMGWIKALGASLSAGELRSGFPGWELVSAEQVSVAALMAYIGWSRVLRRALTEGKLVAWCYRLRRLDGDGR